VSAVSVICARKQFARYQRAVLETAEFTLSSLGKSSSSLDIFLVSEPFMHNLNKKYRGKDVSTNVLSFSCSPDFKLPPLGADFLGEIFISPAFVREHAQSMDQMVVHGILHLCGFDHETERDRMIMERHERTLLESLR